MSINNSDLLPALGLIFVHSQPREKGKLRFHMLQNVETALNFLERKNVKLVNVHPNDIVDGNPKLTLGLIWTIILHFQVSSLPLLTYMTRCTVRICNAHFCDEQTIIVKQFYNHAFNKVQTWNYRKSRQCLLSETAKTICWRLDKSD